MFESEVFIQAFELTLGCFGLFVAITMPIVFKNMKYEGEQLGFLGVFSAIQLGIVLATFVGSVRFLVANGAEPTAFTYLLAAGLVSAIYLFYKEFMQYLFD